MYDYGQMKSARRASGTRRREGSQKMRKRALMAVWAAVAVDLGEVRH